MPFAEIGTEAVFRYAAFASGTQSQSRLLALMLLFSRVALGTLVIVRIGLLLLTIGWLFVPCGVALLLFFGLSLFLLSYRLGPWLLRLGLGLLFVLCRFSLLLLFRGLGLWFLLLSLRLMFFRFGLLLLLGWFSLLFVLRWLGLFFLMFGLRVFVMLFLCEGRNGVSDKQEQYGCADDSNCLHEYCLRYSHFIRRALTALRALLFAFNDQRPISLSFRLAYAPTRMWEKE
jgi:hypothetical protein